MARILNVDKLKEENKQLKAKWSKLKRLLMSMNSEVNWQSELWFSKRVLEKVLDLEKGETDAKD